MPENTCQKTLPKNKTSLFKLFIDYTPFVCRPMGEIPCWQSGNRVPGRAGNGKQLL